MINKKCDRIMESLIESLKKDLDKFNKDNERLEIQITTCEDMIHNYKLKMKENNEAIDSIYDIIEGKF